MANERLRTAMATAHVATEEVSRAAGVDVKTVQRWLAGRTPHARHRWAVAKLLAEDERYLWPDSERSASNGGATPEIVAAYGHRADVPAQQWWDAFVLARRQIDLLGFAMLFIPEAHPRLVELLATKAADSCQIRIALADPSSPYVQDRDAEEGLGGAFAPRIRNTLVHFHPLLGRHGVEINQHRTPMYNSVFRFDDEMFVTPHLYATPGYRAPLLHLRRLGPGGIFDSFADHFEAIWKVSTPVEAAS